MHITWILGLWNEGGDNKNKNNNNNKNDDNRNNIKDNKGKKMEE